MVAVRTRRHTRARAGGAHRADRGHGHSTADYGIGADLCEFMEFQTELLQVCGDSFAGQGAGFGNWFSPIALHVDRSSLDSPGGVVYTRVTGVDKPLLADARCRGHPNCPPEWWRSTSRTTCWSPPPESLVPVSSRLVKAEAAQGLWETVPGSRRDAGYQGGGQSQISGYYDPIPTPDSSTGWVYIVANSFDRSQPVRLFRVPPRQFPDRGKWQAWSAEAGWNRRPTPLWVIGWAR